MRMNFNKIIASLLVLALAMTSCNKWLDVRPVTEVPEDYLFENEQGFFEALSGVYINMGKSNLYGQELTIGLMDVLAYQYDPTGFNNALYTDGKDYNYTSNFVIPTIDGIWSSMYKNIANLNVLLANIDAKKSVFTGNNYQLAKGQALGLRAYLHFDLYRLFGSAVSSGMPGAKLPYVTDFKPDPKATLTGQEFIAACNRDLDEALALLSADKAVRYANTGNNFYSFTRNRFNYYAALALKARIALYQGDRPNAYRYAHMVTDANLFPFTDLTKVTTGGDRTFSTEHVFALQSSDLPAVFNNVIVPGIFNTPEAAVRSLYENQATDYRFVTWKSVGTKLVNTKFQQTGFGVDSANVSRQMPLLRLSEQYYILAESTDNIDSATFFLNAVRNARGIPGKLTGLTISTLKSELQKEYRKEFYSEGQLFFYYKRLNVINMPNNGLPMGDKQYVWPIPRTENEYGN